MTIPNLFTKMEKRVYYTMIGISCLFTVISLLSFVLINLQMNMTKEDWATIIAGLKFFLAFGAIVFIALMIVGGSAFLIFVMGKFSMKSGKGTTYQMSPTFNVGGYKTQPKYGLSEDTIPQLKQSKVGFVPFNAQDFQFHQEQQDNRLDSEIDDGYQILGEGR